jgi:hypothetical protein
MNRLWLIVVLLTLGSNAYACHDLQENQFTCDGPNGCHNTQYAAQCVYSTSGGEECILSGYGLCCGNQFNVFSVYGECRKRSAASLSRQSHRRLRSSPELVRLFVPDQCGKRYAVFEP